MEQAGGWWNQPEMFFEKNHVGPPIWFILGLRSIFHPNPKTMDTYGYHSVYAPGTGMFKLAFLVRLDISGHSRFGLSGT